MARLRWVALALALPAAGCGPMACELRAGHFELDCCLELALSPFWEEACDAGYILHEWETCKGLGYTLPCPMADGSSYWKRPEAHCW